MPNLAPVPLHAAFDRAARDKPPRRGRGWVALASGLIAAILVLALGSSGALAATTVTPKCDGVNLRTGAGTSYTAKTSVDEGDKLTVVSTVTGGSYTATCGTSLSGSSWHKISAINGTSVTSLYGVSYLYGASKLFATVTTPTTAPTGSTTSGTVTLPSSITFHGRGYGHGVGLSQYGAYGRALDGQSAEKIVAHYFQGTTLGTMSNSEVRVLVLQAFAATSTNPVVVYGRGGTWSIDGISKTFPADAKLQFKPTVSGTTTTWKVVVTATDGSTLHSATSSNSIRIRPASGVKAQLWSKPSSYDTYRGRLVLIGKTNGTSTVNVINELAIEYYLRGVVPVEVPSTWPTEAIKAQAIAARSYAANHRHPDTGTYDFYDDTRSQVYRGSLAEKTASTAAITATAGVVVRTSSGGIANTMFHSAAGGWTENNENVFVSSTGAKTAGVVSYLRGVSDRRSDGSSYDEASPWDTWKTSTYTLAQIQSWFAADSRTNVGTLVALDLRNRGVSGRLISVTLIGANGTTKKVSGDVFRSVFNAKRPSGDPQMRSSLFDLKPIP